MHTSWFDEDGLRYDKQGNILRKDQDNTPVLEVGDRFFDVAIGRWALLIRIKPPHVALGAPFEALYEGCDRSGPFIGTAMHADIGEVVKLDESR